MGDQSIKVGVGWLSDLKVVLAQVVDGLIVHEESTVAVLEGGVSVQHSIVRLHNCCGHLKGGAIFYCYYYVCPSVRDALDSEMV